MIGVIAVPVFIKPGCCYYFWDKRRNKLGSFVVEERRSNGFSFQYEGKRYVSSFIAAGGKVFYRDVDVPQYREELEALRDERRRNADESIRKWELELKKQRPPVDPNTYVVYGD